MQVLRNMGLKQVTAEIDILWDGGIVEAQAVNVKFSDSYRYDHLPEAQFKDIDSAQIGTLRRFFRIVMAQEAREDLVKEIRTGFVAGYKTEPLVLATFGYTLFDTPCIPPRVYGPGSESIITVRELLTMKPIL
ncbi:MAG TPA: hypothetical protein VNX88_07675 [Terriglobales bacterium]|nr:hypothetical protein [Terriglobales bacterium]